jgi:hypothetical protein
MFFLRLTLYTCAFYFAIALPVIIAELAAEFWKNGSFGIFFSGRAGVATFAAFWGIVWLASFALAFRATFPGLWARLAG